MRRVFIKSLLLLAIIHLSSCSVQGAVVVPSPDSAKTSLPAAQSSPTAGESSPAISFADPVLESLVRGAMGKTEGAITLIEAQTLTRLDLSNDWKRFSPDEPSIRQLDGLEKFVNLEMLDLSGHGISNISALSALTNLTRLSLAGNPIRDISALAKLGGLKMLDLSNCEAEDYTPIAGLTNLEVLKLMDSSISDAAPLAALEHLQFLFLGDSPVENLYVLSEIFQNLEESDFMVPSTLQDLGFSMDQDHLAWFENENYDVRINHSSWGEPSGEMFLNCLSFTMSLKERYKTFLGWYGNLDTFVVMIVDGDTVFVNYLYDRRTGEFGFARGDRESSEAFLSELFDIVDGEDILLAPIHFLEKETVNTFHMTPADLYALPFEPLTLKSLGFFPDKENAVCLYEQRGDWDYNLEIHRPEWGEQAYDVRFFTPISDEYRIVATYHANENIIRVGLDDNHQGGAAFIFYLDTNEFVDEGCSEQDMTVEEYLTKAYDDPEIEDVYLHTIDKMRQYFVERFGLTFQEMYALPGCD